ncbi:glycoside hydrolase [Rickenella mellea]|uniref:glucan endo-1,3-beta-D-glucosidase n=1 Tax=Rickenella mellea TaxID=50990 RepID=A0A4Y7QJA4_9AGAM|nr:glycoside hydrolase [Rickenella mellea]
MLSTQIRHLSVFTTLLLSLFGTRSGVAYASCVPDTTSANSAKTTPRLQQIKNMYGFGGFVYALDNCPSSSQLVSDFSKMKAAGARMAITFDFCGDGDDPDYYGEVIQAAGKAGIHIIPLAWTLYFEAGQTWSNTAIPKIKAVTQAVIENPGPVLAVAFGDEPLFDNDAGSPANLAKYILQMKSDFKNAGLSDIPISISDMAYGWQSAGDISAVAAAVDFFMINNFPYFNFNAQSGGSASSWSDFTADIAYFESIANGRPLLVTQTGWPSNQNLWSPNSPNVVTSISSEEGFWNLLDDHCKDFFKAKKIAWLWRGWDDTLDGWGVLRTDGSKKWNFSAKQTC